MAFQDQIEDFKEQLQSIDFSEIRADNIGSWPMVVKAGAWLIAFVAIVIAGYNFIIKDLELQKEQVEMKEVTLRQDYQKKAFEAANLDVYRQQMEEMSEAFEAMLSQLPGETEVPGLLEDITNKGVSAGLAFEAIDLQPEQKKEYYVQLPIAITAAGSYHDMGAFVSGVASLPRIVTLSDFKIEPQGDRRENSSLKISVLAHTYRYNDEQPSAGKKPAARR